MVSIRDEVFLFVTKTILDHETCSEEAENMKLLSKVIEILKSEPNFELKNELLWILGNFLGSDSEIPTKIFLDSGFLFSKFLIFQNFFKIFVKDAPKILENTIFSNFRSSRQLINKSLYILNNISPTFLQKYLFYEEEMQKNQQSTSSQQQFNEKDKKIDKFPENSNKFAKLNMISESLIKISEDIPKYCPIDNEILENFQLLSSIFCHLVMTLNLYLRKKEEEQESYYSDNPEVMIIDDTNDDEELSNDAKTISCQFLLNTQGFSFLLVHISFPFTQFNSIPFFSDDLTIQNCLLTIYHLTKSTIFHFPYFIQNENVIRRIIGLLDNETHYNLALKFIFLFFLSSKEQKFNLT